SVASRRRSGRSTTAPAGVSSRSVTGHGLATVHPFANFPAAPSGTSDLLDGILVRPSPRPTAYRRAGEGLPRPVVTDPSSGRWAMFSPSSCAVRTNPVSESWHNSGHERHLRPDATAVPRAPGDGDRRRQGGAAPRDPRPARPPDGPPARAGRRG